MLLSISLLCINAMRSNRTSGPKISHSFEDGSLVRRLPGTPLGNTGLSWSDVLLGNLPNVYIYAGALRRVVELKWVMNARGQAPGHRCWRQRWLHAACSRACPGTSRFRVCLYLYSSSNSHRGGRTLRHCTCSLDGEIRVGTAANNPSESIIAKRRGYGTIVSHNVPPYGRAGLYKQLAELQAMVTEYREDPESIQVLRRPILAALQSAGVSPRPSILRLGADCNPVLKFLTQTLHPGCCRVGLAKLSGVHQNCSICSSSQGRPLLAMCVLEWTISL